MFAIAAVNWSAFLIPRVSVLELVLRGSLMYLFVFAAMRLFRRQSGALSTADLLVVVMVADAAQNAMASDYQSVPEGAVLVGTIFCWNYGLDWLALRSSRLHRLLNPQPLLLIKDGRVQQRNLRHEMLTRGDLRELLREQGIERFEDVKRCVLEGEGHVSVIRRSKDEAPPPTERRTF